MDPRNRHVGIEPGEILPHKRQRTEGGAHRGVDLAVRIPQKVGNKRPVVIQAIDQRSVRGEAGRPVPVVVIGEVGVVEAVAAAQDSTVVQLERRADTRLEVVAVQIAHLGWVPTNAGELQAAAEVGEVGIKRQHIRRNLPGDRAGHRRV